MGTGYIHFWDPERPGCNPHSLQEAIQISLHLALEPAAPDPKFRTFLAALLKKWPSKRMLSGPDDPRTSIWDGCPLLGLDQYDVARYSLLPPADGGDTYSLT